uniref:Uncharacterized protein n=1 Tax=Alexandrium catenella TaxID=2925 RepID=A0A7S1WRA7_ALECA
MASVPPCTLGARAPGQRKDEDEEDEPPEEGDAEGGAEAAGEAKRVLVGAQDFDGEFQWEPDPWWMVSWSVTMAFSPGKAPAKWHVRGLGKHRAIPIHAAFTDFVLTNKALWLYTFGFIAVQLSFVAMTGDGFFGNLTGGVVESLRLTTGTSMTWHVFSGSALWSLAFVQIFLRQLRRGPLAWVHRASGRLYLLLWCFIVGPTSAYLSLVVGLGRAHAHFFMAMFALTGIDTTVFAYYYFWRALVVVRYRTNGEDSRDLHGRAMRTGSKFTMLILWQRSVQFLVIALRWLILSLLRVLSLPTLWAGAVAAGWIPAFLRVLVEGVVALPFDHNVILSYTTVVPAAVMLGWVDGPRSSVLCWAMSLKESEVEALFGSREPGRFEKWAWRLRVPLYVALRVVAAQRGWIEGMRDDDGI